MCLWGVVAMPVRVKLSTIYSARSVHEEFGRLGMQTHPPVEAIFFSFRSCRGSQPGLGEIYFKRGDPGLTLGQPDGVIPTIFFQSLTRVTLLAKFLDHDLGQPDVLRGQDPQQRSIDHRRQGRHRDDHRDRQPDAQDPTRPLQDEDLERIRSAHRRTRSAGRISPRATTRPRASRVVPSRGS